MPALLLALALPWVVIVALLTVVLIQRRRVRREVASLNAQAARDHELALRAWQEGDKRSPPPRPPHTWVVG